MNLPPERIAALCDSLNLPFVAQGYCAAIQKAAKQEMAYSDFLEWLLREEAAGRNVRRQSTMTRRGRVKSPVRPPILFSVPATYTRHGQGTRIFF
ncbi:ATP-binding protein [Massilia sp. TWP1-3-3]|uniref:ATP-binding protein n=1 Tax=Massilia sp. TWP1-3-3 TaxID=2804573 RepID=UPI003CF9A64F